MAKKRKKQSKKIQQREISQQRLASQLEILQSESSSKSKKRRAKKFLKMKGIDTQQIKTMPAKIEASQLEAFKAKYADLVEECNNRILSIHNAGYESYAINRLINETGRDYFDISEVSSREDLITEVTRMRGFISDKGSTVDGAREESAQMARSFYAGAFGNRWKNNGNNYAFDPSRIDPDVAETVFKYYRMIEENRAALIGKQGMAGVYGSENLIIAMYDAEIRGKDSYLYGMDLLDEYENEINGFAFDQFRQASEAESISGRYEESDYFNGGKLW